MLEEKLDRLKIAVRFVCGTLAGGLAGLWAAFGTDWSAGELTGAVTAGALVFGCCAVAFGDRFWHALGGWSRW